MSVVSNDVDGCMLKKQDMGCAEPSFSSTEVHMFGLDWLPVLNHVLSSEEKGKQALMALISTPPPAWLNGQWACFLIP